MNHKEKPQSIWTAVKHCLAHPQSYDGSYLAVCREMSALRSQRDSAESALEEAKRESRQYSGEVKRRTIEYRQLRDELRAQAQRLQDAQESSESLAQQVAETQAAKNSA